MPRAHPNLLFVCADQWRAHALSSHRPDPDPVSTPRMRQFAEEGAALENTCTCSPICTPSRASILSGRHPFSVGMMHNWLQFPVDEPSLGRSFKAAGYRTGYIGKWHLDAFLPGDDEHPWNIFTPPGERRQGFDMWYAHGCNHNHFTLKYMDTQGDVHRGAGWQLEHETDRALAYLDDAAANHAEEPFCLFLAWSPPHTNHGGDRDTPGVRHQFYAPEADEAPFRRADLPVRENAHEDAYRKAAPGYFGAVESMDLHFGRLLDALDRLGLAEDTLVVLTADHGEMLASHGMFTKDVWYEESIRIPFLLRWPGKVPGGSRRRSQLSTIDFFPTLAGLAGVPIPEGRHGVDRSAWIRGEAEEFESDLFLAHNCGSPYGLLPENFDYPPEPGRKWRGVRTDRHTYVALDNTPESQYRDAARFALPVSEGVREILYDNQADPTQQSPIFRGAGQDALMDTLHERVARWLDGLGDPFLREEWAGNARGNRP